MPSNRETLLGTGKIYRRKEQLCLIPYGLVTDNPPIVTALFSNHLQLWQ